MDTLKTQIAEAAAGKRFILHGGDCVERFDDCNAEVITNKLKILLQMSVILAHAARVPVLRMGRLAGQFFKPRSQESERVGGLTLPTYRGDTVNGFDATEKDRNPQPDRLLGGYFHAAATLNYIRAMIDGGFADLHHPYSWNLHSIERTEQWPEYRLIVERILDAIHFMESFGGVKSEMLGKIEFFTSHEGLHLPYEAALTRAVDARFYNLGAHFLWIGDRTREIGDAHVEYFRGIANPIGLKLSGTAQADEVIRLLDVLNPTREEGRITLITRMGHNQVTESLPPLIRGVHASGHPVAWTSDPMHGNTAVTAGGVKTREFSHILAELSRTFEIHDSEGSRLAGVHFELTGDDVTECTGGAIGLGEDDLSRNYQTWCDPRLNYAQSLEMAFLLTRLLGDRGHGSRVK